MSKNTNRAATAAVSSAAPAASNAPASPSIENVAGIKYPFFAEVANGETLVIAGVLKETDEKETPYGPVKRYKGDFAIRHQKNGRVAVAPVPAVVKDGKEVTPAIAGVAAIPASVVTVRSGTVYFPAQIGDQLLTKAAAIPGGWDSLEFKLSATKSNGGFPSVSWSVEPRVEGDRVLSLLNS